MPRNVRSGASIMTGVGFSDRAAVRHHAIFNPHVHGARGLFSMMVFIFHVAHSNVATFDWASDPYAVSALMALQYGVELFFGISGIVIVGAMARSPGLGAFAWDRATRILPVLWVSIAAVLLLTLVSGGSFVPQTVWHWLGNFLPPPPFVLIPLVNPPAWSLGYEIFFYCLAALAWTWRGNPGLPALAWCGGLLLVIAFPRALLMMPGVLIALGLLKGDRLRGLHRSPGISLLLFLTCWRLAPIVEWNAINAGNLLGPFYVPFADWLKALPLIVAGGLFGTLALVGIHEGRGMLSRLLATRPLLWLGTISYSFYLWHPMVLAVVKRGSAMIGIPERVGQAGQLLLFLVALPMVLVVSWISQRMIEVRFTRWLRRFGPAKPAGPVDRVLAATDGDLR